MSSLIYLCIGSDDPQQKITMKRTSQNEMCKRIGLKPKSQKNDTNLIRLTICEYTFCSPYLYERKCEDK